MECEDTNHPKYVLLLGGTGTLSKAVLDEALRNGCRMTIINRGKTSRETPVGVETLFCDVYDESKLRSHMKGRTFDVIVDFLSRTPSDIEKLYTFLGSICRQYIFISTACVYRRNVEDLPIKESSPKPNVDWSYNIEKYACEQTLKELSEKSKSWYTIVRPYITYDNERIPFGIAPAYKYHRTLIERIKCGKPMFVWDDGSVVTTSTPVSEFAVGVVGLFLNAKARNEDFHITSSHNYPLKDVLILLYRKLGKEPRIVEIPSQEVAQTMPLYREMLQGDRMLPAVFDNTKISSAVREYKSEITLSEGLDGILDHYAHKSSYDYDYQYDGLVDRLLRRQGIKCCFVRYPHATNADRWKYLISRSFPYTISSRFISFLKL